MAIFCGAATAFVLQSAVSVGLGHTLSRLPEQPVKILSALLFFALAWLAWRREPEHEEENPSQNTRATFMREAWISFTVIFIAEWGDLTQFATAALAARYQQPFTIFAAATLALWFVTAAAIVVGSNAKHWMTPALLNKLAAAAFAITGGVLLIGAFRNVGK